jgi:hypothetical protein
MRAYSPGWLSRKRSAPRHRIWLLRDVAPEKSRASFMTKSA